MKKNEVANDGKGAGVGIKKRELFQVDQKQFFYTRVFRSYQQYQGQIVSNTRVVKEAAYFWWTGSKFSKGIDNVDYDVPGEVRTTHRGWTDLLSQIERLLQEERVYGKKREKYGIDLLMRQEQKSIAWIQGLVQKYTKPRNLDADAFAGALSITKGCVLLCKHAMLVRCELFPSCVTEVML